MKKKIKETTEETHERYTEQGELATFNFVWDKQDR